MKLARKLVAVALPLLVVQLTAPDHATAQSSALVLVAPLSTGAGVKDDFGRKVSEEVAKGLESFDAIEPIDKDDLKDAMKKFGLEGQTLTPIQWRQLASQLNADLVMHGSAEPSGGGILVTAVFVQASSGDELPIPNVTVSGDGNGQAQDASDHIVSAFGEQVEYLKSLQFCQEYLAASQFEDALRNCTKAVDLRPDGMQGVYFHARAMMGLERYQEAVSGLERVLAEDPSNDEAIQSAAFTHAQLGNADRATELYRQYLDYNPDDADVRLNVAFNLAQAGAYDAAIEIIQGGLERDDSNAGLWQYLGNVALAKATASGSANGSESGNGGTLQDTASAHLAVDAYGRYLDLVEEAVDAAIVLNVLKAHMALGDHQSAFDLSDRLLAFKNGSGSTASTAGAGVAGIEVGEITDADRATYWALRADMLAALERPGDAGDAMRRALEFQPDYPNGFLKLGIFTLQSGDSEAAIADFRRAVDAGADPDIVASQLLARGYNDHFKNGRYGPAIAMFETALEFASQAQTTQQLNFFIGYGVYQVAVGIDEGNASEACQPAQRALSQFRRVPGYIRQAGTVQQASQGQILEATDTYIFRQEQIVKKAC